MEGVETATGALGQPARKGKAAAKPAAKGTAAKRKATEVVEAAEKKTEAAEEAPTAEERPAKRRAVAKAKKPAETLQPVEHPSHQKEAGEVFVMGTADCGQLGLGEDVTEVLRARLSSIASGQKVVQVAAGGMHSVALTVVGQVYTCGVNDEGALGRETKGAPWETCPQATGNTSDSYKWDKVEVPISHGKIVQVSAGDSHTMALTEHGFIYGWGTFRNSSGVFAFSPEERLALLPRLAYSPGAAPRQAVKIVSGTDHVVALLRSGALLSWGTGEQGRLGRIGARLPEKGLKELLLTPAEVSMKRSAKAAAADPITDIAAGNYSTFAVTQSGQVWAWGLNNYGQLGLEGEEPVHAPKQVKTLASEIIAAVGPGQHHTLFLTQSGRLLSVGRPTYGRLGRKDAEPASDAPMATPEGVHIQDTGLHSTTIAGIVAGPEVSAALGADGRAWLWGFGTNNQLGNGNDDSDKEVPSLLKAKALQGQRIVQVDFGGQHTLLVVTGDGAESSAAVAAADGTAALANGVAMGIDMDPTVQDEDAALSENGLLAGEGHAEVAAKDGIAAAEPRQGDPLLQETTAVATETPTELPAAPAQPAAPLTMDVDMPMSSAAAPDAQPKVDATAAPAALTHSASGEQLPAQDRAAAAPTDQALAATPMPDLQDAAPISFPGAVPSQGSGQAFGMNYVQVSGPGPSKDSLAVGVSAANATATAAEVAAAEVAQMVDSMINVPETERTTAVAQPFPAAVEQAQQAAALHDAAAITAAPVAEDAYITQPSIPEISALLSVPASLPGYVEPATDQPHNTSALENTAIGATAPASEASEKKSSDLEEWRKSFYALSGSTPM